MTAHKWQFVARFRYHAFGWQSDKPIQRIKEALSEIKRVVKKEPELAAAGAVLFLEKISPAIEQVDFCFLVVGSRPFRDRHRFPVNGWLTLKSGHSEAASQAPKPVIQILY